MDWQAAGPRGLRQADRLPRAPAAPLQRPLGAQQDARAADRAGGRRLARPQPARVAAGDDRARRLPPRQHDGRRRAARPAWSPIFDWELATIGDPLADVGYLTITWVQHGDPEDTMFSSLSARHAARGLPDPRGADRPLRGALRALDGRAQLVPGAGALEGGGVHGGQLQALPRRLERRRATWALFDEGVPLLAEKAREIALSVKGLLVDFGGVLTTNVFDSFRAFCAAEGLERRRVPDAVPRRARGARRAAPGGDRARSTEEEFWRDRSAACSAWPRPTASSTACSPACARTSRWSRPCARRRPRGSAPA